MRLLAVETSGLRCGVALLEDGQLRAWIESEQGLTHSRALMPLLDSLLSSQNLSAADLDLLAVSEGPGSFTGLRIGVATMQGMAAAAGLRVIPVSTLAALAEPWLDLGLPVLSLIDARHQRCYAALYDQEHGARPADRLAPAVYELEQLAHILSEEELGECILTGDGQAYASESEENPLTALRKAGFVLRRSGEVNCSATAVARLAWRAWQQDPAAALEPAELRPVYLNRTAAEKNLGIEVD